MQFAQQTGLTLILFWAGLAVLLRGRVALMATSGALICLLGLKQLPVWSLSITGTLLGIGIMLEMPVKAWIIRQGQGDLINELSGVVLPLLVFGIFFGPLTSLALWLIAIGFKFISRIKSRVGFLSGLAGIALRGFVAFGLVIMGLYGIYV
ncbi:MAG: hypothetical protein M0Z55_04850 [Peptococcaceae bacterium]|nr:hypothetical protein [Peptococcaceae bacterium]